MVTTTGQDVLYAAAELAARTRDQVPAQEQVMLQNFIALEFLTLFSVRAWPDFTPPLLNVAAANEQFSKQQAGAVDGWLGEILGVYDHNPQGPAGHCGRHHARPVSFYGGDGVVRVDTSKQSLWVEYMRPYPTPADSEAEQTFPDLAQLSLADFMQQILPFRWRNTLAMRAAGLLLGADQNIMQASYWKGQGEEELGREILRLPPAPPWRRTLRLSFPRRRWARW